jgi:hypothetical protein
MSGTDLMRMKASLDASSMAMGLGVMASEISCDNITKVCEGGQDVLLDLLLRKDFW